MNDDAFDPKLYRKIVDNFLYGTPLEEPKIEIEVCKHKWVWFNGFLRNHYICTECNKSVDNMPDDGIIVTHEDDYWN